jgi:hypothetical protein
MPFACISLPVAVTLNRFFAPLCVFSFCFVTALTALPFLSRLLLLERIHKQDHRPTLEPRRCFDRAMRPQEISEPIQQSSADIRMRHLPSAEQYGQFHFVAGIEKLGGLSAFRFQIVIVDLRTNSNFLQLDDVLVPARLTLLTALLISELAVVHESGDRRNCVGSDLDKIQPTFAGHLERFSRLHDPDLFAGLVDEANLPNPDPLIDACLHWSGYSSPP